MHQYSDYYYYLGNCDEFTKVLKIAVFCDAGNGMRDRGAANLFVESGRAVNLFSLLDAMSSDANNVQFLVHLCSYNSNVYPIESGFLPAAYARAVLKTKNWLMNSEGIPDIGCIFRYLDSFKSVDSLDAVIVLSKNFSVIESKTAMMKEHNFNRFAIGIYEFNDLTDDSQLVLRRFLMNTANYYEADGLAVREVINKIKAIDAPPTENRRGI